MTNIYKISVVIPCFNHGEYLPEAVDSVINLKRDDIELIVIDDGSTDERTHREINLLIARGIKVVRQENKGLASARNIGINIAKGEFILSLDSDNRIRESYIVSGLKLLQNEPAVGIVYGNAEYFGEKTGLWQTREFDLIELVRGNFIDACALYRKSVWDTIRGYDEKMPWMGWEDWDFWLRAAASGWGFSHLNEIAFDYRVRSGSMIEETNRHQDELLAYIFSKPHNQAVRLIREQSFDNELLMQRIRNLENSRDYRLGRLVLSPLRLLKRHLLKSVNSEV
jgi:glycosyltransferase involved in cell wall biosynthesis